MVRISLHSSKRFRRFFRRWTRAQQGAAAVEVALLATPFFILIFGIVELAMVLLASATLEFATAAAAREIRTGSFQSSPTNSATDFRDLVCSRMSWLSSGCGARLNIDVRTFSDFSSLSVTAGFNGSTFDPTKTCWSTGGPLDIVLVRSYYRWPLFTPLLSDALADTTDKQARLLTSAVAFRNEPYSESPPGGAKC